MKLIQRLASRYFKGLPLLAVLAVASSGIGVMIPWVLGKLISELGKKHANNSILCLFVLLLTISLLGLLIELLRSRKQIKLLAMAQRLFQNYIWNSVVALSLPRYYKDSPGVWMQKICSDSSVVCRTYLTIVMSFLNFSTYLIGIAIVVFMREPMMCFVFVVALTAGIFIHNKFKDEISCSARVLREEAYAFNSMTFDSLMLYPRARMFKLSVNFDDRFCNSTIRLSEKAVDSEFTGAKYSFGLQLVFCFVHFTVLGGCILLYFGDRIEIGDILTFDLLVTQLIGGLSGLLVMMPQIDQGIESASALRAVLDESAGCGGVELAHIASDDMVRLDGVCFKYEERGKSVLDEVSCRIRKHEFVCCCGGNGSGKTTLLNVIMGILAPDSGGVSTSACRPAIVPQRVVVFRGTVVENVRMFDSSISEGKVISVLCQCGLGPWIESLESGVRTEISSEMISGGELQRIGVARALVRDPDFIVVDELANNLDIVEKRRIENLVQSLRGRCTILSVSHDMDSIGRYDRVWVMNDGGIVDIRDEDRTSMRRKVERLIYECKNETTCS